ncbi:UDP-N-acetylmuramate dehydrogenase [Vibrio lentus]|uniref:UDP-N-acetylenolpyruvoylglucosamine reductase n=1 Tax=Vibrio lentus TaxID=136468 RepID=A0A2N7C648_9VIBR|nr:UDP-N-acetylmuramate dehydrogenase [Vibrio lentus]PME54104.1 UDP-N-acetylenolpyruvoylglucosamine reductase [Vibrio lentus]PME71373.1 UDP-N-acetylenolpyruvoylglucosamine reductase [Vibrio lentus]PME86344.1 UDP-N-acetylenolpyruvoylglucosamine reductase [Vibrio lentus]PMH93767.1 UDP-N-acetylenolpyruvoylglucosamine reductase [Vibrio lentus]PMI10284.1 UDP-N-acetylenolpyruvoylglucosamine reductase [Vibrio lentus]
MQSYLNASLKNVHTFSIEQTCDVLVEVTSVDELISVYQDPQWSALPKLMLGKGSNMLFTEHFAGLVIVNKLAGIELTETDSHHLLHVSGGEDWPSLVEWSVDHGLGGLENLAMIPGCSGSAPIQNIGAYGVELQDVCEYVDILCLDTYTVKRLSKDECLFGYRDSIFKNALYGKAIVVAIGLTLAKEWKPCNHYGPLKSLPTETLSPRSIFDEVCAIRSSKLPDPSVQGNAGSFFKNPVITKDHFDRLSELFPNIVGYESNDMIKVAAGWLIDQCQFKGVIEGGAQVHPNQALVIINYDEASAVDILKLAARVRQAVLDKFDIPLEHEVRFMGQDSETNLDKALEAMA